VYIAEIYTAVGKRASDALEETVHQFRYPKNRSVALSDMVIAPVR